MQWGCVDVNLGVRGGKGKKSQQELECRQASDKDRVGGIS